MIDSNLKEVETSQPTKQKAIEPVKEIKKVTSEIKKYEPANQEVKKVEI